MFNGEPKYFSLKQEKLVWEAPFVVFASPSVRLTDGIRIINVNRKKHIRKVWILFPAR